MSGTAMLTDSTSANPAARQPLLSVRNLYKRFEVGDALLARNRTQVRAVEDISFTVERGQVVGLVGESGSGKTTTGRAVLRLVEPTAGEILFEGIDLMRLCRKPVVNLGCGMRALHFGELADVQWPSLRPISNPAVRTLVSGL